jgi:Zn-dependent peptidase ImmA (M78 family)
MKPQVNPYLRRIAGLVSEKNRRQPVQAFVAAHRSASESLDALARKLGVSRITEERLPFEGGLFELPDGELVVKLNSESSLVRKRFTLAHELAHLLLETVPAFRGRGQADIALERTCDMIAAELLIPSEDATAFVRSLGRPSPEKLQIIASKYVVSLYAAAIRVHSDFDLWKCYIGCWECHPQIKTAWFVGRRRWDKVEPDSYSLDLALSSDAPVRSKELWQRGPHADPVWLNLLRIGDKRVLGLIDFVN